MQDEEVSKTHIRVICFSVYDLKQLPKSFHIQTNLGFYGLFWKSDRNGNLRERKPSEICKNEDRPLLQR